MVSILFMFSTAQLLTKTRCSVGAVHRSPGFGMSSNQQQQSIDQLWIWLRIHLGPYIRLKRLPVSHVIRLLCWRLRRCCQPCLQARPSALRKQRLEHGIPATDSRPELRAQNTVTSRANERSVSIESIDNQCLEASGRQRESTYGGVLGEDRKVSTELEWRRWHRLFCER